MSRLIRLDRTGHTTLAEWSSVDQASYERAARAFALEREAGIGRRDWNSNPDRLPDAIVY